MTEFADRMEKLIGQFEKNYRDAFSKTVDMFTYYTGIRFECELRKFGYRFSPANRFKVLSSLVEYYNCDSQMDDNRYVPMKERKEVVFTKILMPEKNAETILRDYSISTQAAHEAGELLYCMARDEMGRTKYKIAGEIVGDYFLRLFCKNHGVKDSKFKMNFYGRYRISEMVNDYLDILPLSEQIAKIRKLVFMRDVNERLSRTGERMLDFLEYIDRPRRPSPGSKNPTYLIKLKEAMADLIKFLDEIEKIRTGSDI